MQHQRPLRRGQRKQVSSRVAQGIRRAVEREAARYHVSMSFVTAVALAYALDVPLDENDTYKTLPRHQPVAWRVISGGRRKRA